MDLGWNLVGKAFDYTVDKILPVAAVGYGLHQMSKGARARAPAAAPDYSAQRAQMQQAFAAQQLAFQEMQAQLAEEKTIRAQAEQQKKDRLKAEEDRAQKSREEGRLRLAIEDNDEPLVISKPRAQAVKSSKQRLKVLV